MKKLQQQILDELSYDHSRSLEGMVDALKINNGYLFSEDIEKALKPLVASGEVVIEECGCVYKAKLE